MPVIQTKPAQTLSGIPGTYKTGVVVPASNLLVVDDVESINNYSIKWIVTIVDTVASKTMVCEILAINKFNTTMSHNVYGIVGDFIAHGVNVQLNLGKIQLVIMNNETHNIEVSIVRIQAVH